MMLLFDEIPQPLAFYDELEKQARFHSGYGKHMHRLLVQQGNLLPFQVRFAEGDNIISAEVFSAGGDLVEELQVANFVSATAGGFQYYIWKGDSPMKTATGENLSLFCGQEYYLRLRTTFGDCFSEVFSPLEDINRYLMLEWAEAHHVDPVYYEEELGFRFRLFVDTVITKGLPSIVIESEEDGHGQVIDISRKVNITYDIDFGIIPNYLYEAIAFMAIHRDVTVTTPRNLREGNIKNIALEHVQVESLAYWHLVMTFQQGRYYYNTACENNIAPPYVEEALIDQGATGEQYDTFIEQREIL